MNILVVDDETLVCMGSAAMVEELGHTPIEAYSGSQALNILETRTDIDLLIADVGMPNMDGVELAQKTMRLRPTLPVILVTGYINVPANEPLNLPQLSKPFTTEQLSAAIRLLRSNAE